MPKEYKIKSDEELLHLREDTVSYPGNGFVNESEDDRLLKDSKRSGLENLQLFTKMIRRNVMLNKAQAKK